VRVYVHQFKKQVEQMLTYSPANSEATWSHKKEGPEALRDDTVETHIGAGTRTALTSIHVNDALARETPVKARTRAGRKVSQPSSGLSKWHEQAPLGSSDTRTVEPVSAHPRRV
jgi:hypothetical protein